MSRGGLRCQKVKVESVLGKQTRGRLAEPEIEVHKYEILMKNRLFAARRAFQVHRVRLIGNIFVTKSTKSRPLAPTRQSVGRNACVFDADDSTFSCFSSRGWFSRR